MKFINEMTIDFYDNILKSFCFDSYDNIYYCCILFHTPETNEKIYLCVNIKYFEGYDELKMIIKTASFAQNMSRLPELLILNEINETSLIKARDLRNDQVEFVKYKSNLVISTDILFGKYPEDIEKAAEFDYWIVAYQNHAG